ncbi:L-asparaginase, type II [Phyllosticta citrichinensis]
MRVSSSLVALSTAVFANGATAASNSSLPRVSIIATGGTVAGTNSDSTSTTGYKAGSLGVDALIEAVPALQNISSVSGIQFSNIGSQNMNTSLLLRLTKLATNVAANGSTDGIVITHGTDTLEETAMFLDLTYNESLPIAMAAAMRPSTALSADGPFNIYEAVALAGSKEAADRGVMIVLNDRIGSAMYTTKTNTRSMDTFKAAEQGYLGVFNDKVPVFYFEPSRVYKKPFFDVSGVDALPRVDILYGNIDMDVRLLNYSVSSGAEGVVIACAGDASLPDAWADAAKAFTEQGIPVVRASRTGSGYVAPADDTLTSGNFNAQKARILLQLVLNEHGGKNSTLIQEYFDPYLG